MSDLKYTVEVQGTEDIERLERAMESLTGGMKAARGSGKALEEMRKILVGMKGQSSVIEDLRSSVEGLNTSSDKLTKGFSKDFQALGNVIQKEFKGLGATVENLGKEFAKISAESAGTSKGISQVSAEIEKVGRTAKDTSAKVKLSSGAFKQLEVDSRTTHAAVRGLASGFNLLWLTWGKLMPLFAGAGISHTLTKAFTIGSEVERGIRFMEELGQTTDATGKKIEGASHVIRQELRLLNQETEFSITELKDSMVMLGQAGLTAGESLKTLKASAALSTAGMIPLKDASLGVIQAVNLFGKSMDDAGDVAAKLWAATKEAPINVAELTQSMKMATEANTKFDQSLEETIAIISVLGKSALKGTMAGTAYINMMRDLGGRSGPSIKAMQELRDLTGETLDLFNSGKRKGPIEFFKEMEVALKKLDLKKQDELLTKIFSDRGGRAFYAAMRENLDLLEEFKGRLEEVSETDLFKAQQGLMDTAAGALKILQATMTNTLDEVFEAYASSFKGFIVSVTNAIKQDEFKEVLLQITAAAKGLFDLILNNIGTVALLTKTFIGWKAFTGVRSVILGLTGSLHALFSSLLAVNGGMLLTGKAAASSAAATGINTVATVTGSRATFEYAAAKAFIAQGYTKEAAAAAAATAATNIYASSATKAAVATRAFSSALTFLANPLVGIALTVLTLGAAYFTTKNISKDALEDMAGASDKYTNKSISNISKEISMILLRNKLMSEGDEFLDQELALRKELAQLEKDRATHMTRFYDAEGNLRRGRAQYEEGERRKLAIRETETLNAFVDLENARAEAVEERRIREEKAAAEAAKRAESFRKNLEGGITGITGGTKGKPAFEKAITERANDLAKIKEYYNALESEARDSFQKQQQLLESQRSNQLITDEEYFSRAFVLASRFENDRINLQRDSWAEFQDAAHAELASLTALQSEVKVGGDAWESYAKSIKSVNNELKAQEQRTKTNIAKIQAETYHRLELTANKVAGALRKLTKDEEEFWKKSAAEKEKSRALKEIEKQYDNINKSVFSTSRAEAAAAKAAKTAQLAHVERQRKIVEKIKEEEASVETLRARYLQLLDAIRQGDTSRGTMREFKGLAEHIERLEQELERARAALAQSIEDGIRDGAEAGADAFQGVMDENFYKLRDDLSEAIYLGLTGKGRDAGKALRETLKRELLKEPLMVVIRGVMGDIVGGFFGGKSSAGGKAGGSSMSFGNPFTFAGTAIEAAGSALGLSAVSAFGTGLASGFSSIAGAGVTGWVSAASSLVTSGSAAGAAAGMGMLAGPLLGVLAVASLFGKKKLKDTGISGTFTGDDFSGGTYQYKKGWFSSSTKVTPFEEAVRKQLANDWKAVVTDLTTFADALGLQTDRIKDFSHDFKISMGKPSADEAENAFAEAWAEAMRTGSNELAQQLLGSWEKTVEEVTKTVQTGDFWENYQYEQVTETVETLTYVASEFAYEGEEAIDTLTRLGTAILATNQAFDMLGLALYEASLAGGDMSSQLIELFGDLDTFGNLTSSYFQNFYTEAEKQAYAIRMMEEALSSVGLELPLTTQAFRELVEAQDLTTESGREAFKVLMEVNEVFADIYGTAEDATLTISELKDEIRSLSETIGSDLSTILMDAILDNFEGDDVGMALGWAISDGIEAAIAGYFVNQVVGILVSGLVEPMVAAAVTGASVSTAVSQAAIDKVVAEAREALKIMDAVLSELRGSGILDEIAKSVGSLGSAFSTYTPRATAASRASEAASDAAKEAAKEADKLADAWRKLADSLMDEVNRIRGVIADDSGNGMAYWKSQFAIATAQARSGDQDAAGELPNLSKALLSAAESQAQSQLELQQIRAWVAQSLQDTAGYADAFANGQAPSVSQSSPASVTIVPAAPGAPAVVVQTDPNLAATMERMNETFTLEIRALRELQRDLVRYAKGWDNDGLPVVVLEMP